MSATSTLSSDASCAKSTALPQRKGVFGAFAQSKPGTRGAGARGTTATASPSGGATLGVGIAVFFVVAQATERKRRAHSARVRMTSRRATRSERDGQSIFTGKS
jgi:hypothetical protein